MSENLITIAIRRQEQAEFLVKKLEENGIKAFINEISPSHERVGDGVRVRIHESDLIKALAVIEQLEDLSLAAFQKQSDERKILIPVDFSERSFKACEAGFKLAEKLKAEVVILHAYYITTALYDISASPMHEAELYQCASKISANLSQLEKDINEKIESKLWPNVPFSLKSEEGLPEDVILEYCRKNKPTLVIMSTRSNKQKEQELIGSVTSEVADNCACPIIIIPDNAEITITNNPINLMFATNFDQRTLNTLERMMMLFKPIKFNLFISHFNSEPDKWNEVKLMGIKNYLELHYHEIPCEYKIFDGVDLLTELKKQITLLNIDLIIVNSHKRNLFAKLLNPSTARKLIIQSNIPILVFHS